MFVVVIPKAVVSHIDQSEREKNGDKYKDACRMLGVVPISHLISKLSQNEIRICGYGLGSKGTRALAVALVVSSPFVLLFKVYLTSLNIVELFDSRNTTTPFSSYENKC